MSSSTRSGSKRPMVHTVLAPPPSPVTAAQCSPETWNRGLVTKMQFGVASGAGGLSAMSRAPWKKLTMSSEPRLPCVCTAALGRPVVPLV
jgi:hypothetical protein